MVINQGDIYWADMGEPAGSKPAYFRPFIVVQNNLFNQSRIDTVIACPLTSNLDLARAPGNVSLDKNEANLPKASVVNVSQVLVLDKSQLVEYLGTVSLAKIRQIIRGINLFLEPRGADDVD